MKTALAILLLTLGLVLPQMGTAQSIALSEASPVVGEEVTITLDVAVDTLVVTYRPNSSVATKELLVSATPTTTFQWASRNPGLVEISYPDRAQGGALIRRNVSVRFDGVSASGLAVMFGAGLILFGGAAFAFRTLFQHTEPPEKMDFDPNELPDT